MDAKTDAKTRLERFDKWQQRHRVSAVAMATVKKFQEDHTTNMAATIAFWAFFSIFPLLLAFVTILGYVLSGSTKNSVMSHVASMLPVVDPNSVQNLHGSWWTLLVGVISALWSGSGVVRTVQFAFNSVWEVPFVERPKFVEKLLRSFYLLGTLGIGLIISTVISSVVTSTASGLHLGLIGHIVGFVIAIALDIGIFVAAFVMLTDRDVSVRDMLPGAMLSGIVFFILQQVASLIISRYLKNAQSTYGHFATVITMLWWFYLQSIITLLGAQFNVVLKRQLHPRSMVGGPDTRADHEAYDAYAQERTYHHNEQVDATFHERRS